MATSPGAMSDRVKSAAQKRVGGKAVVGGKNRGGVACFALVDELLKSEGAKSAADFGEVTENADYVWGEAVGLDAVQPGDILQFRDHAVTSRTQTLGETGRWEETLAEGPAVRPHHTAVLVEVQGDGSVVVVEQNVRPKPNIVSRNKIARLSPGEETRYRSNRIKVIISVTGSVWAYRPVSKQGAMLFPRGKESVLVSRRMLAHYYIPAEGGFKRGRGPLGTA